MRYSDVVACVTNYPAPARISAAKVLLRLQRDENVFSAEALDEAIRHGALSPADARLATSLVYGTLRNAMLLDYQIRPFLRMSLSKLAPGLRVLLRMAAFQKFFLERVPDHAIANDSVQIARSPLRLHSRDVAFLNAVLRKLLQKTELSLPGGGDVASLAARYSHPEWLVQYFERKFGQEHLIGLLDADNREAAVCVRVNRLRSSVESVADMLSAQGATVVRGALSPDALVIDGINLQQLVSSSLFTDGQIYFQDEGSQVIAYLVAPHAGERVLDLCAAPGGKSTHLAELGLGKVQVTASDVSASRLKLLEENVGRLGTSSLVTVSPEMLEGTEHQAAYDAVLVDAPCSGLGTLRRNPEIRYRVKPEQLGAIAKTQLGILENAAGFVRAGGRLIYSTCTVTDEENAGVLRAFFAAHPEFSHIVADGELPPGIAALRGGDGIYRTWPQHLQADGFEAAVLVKQSG